MTNTPKKVTQIREGGGAGGTKIITVPKSWVTWEKHQPIIMYDMGDQIIIEKIEHKQR